MDARTQHKDICVDRLRCVSANSGNLADRAQPVRPVVAAGAASPQTPNLHGSRRATAMPLRAAPITLNRVCRMRPRSTFPTVP
jgi:hypothetical protein